MTTYQIEELEYIEDRAERFAGFDRGDLGRDYEADDVAMWEAEEAEEAAKARA